MTPSLPLLAAVSLVVGLLSAPVTGATATGRALPDRTPVTRTPSPHPAAARLPAPDVADTPGAPDMRDVAEHIPVHTAAERERVLHYWTPRRMAAALPLDPLAKVTGLLGRLSSTAGVLRVSARGPHDPVRRAHLSRASAAAVLPSKTAGARWTAGGMVGRTTGRVFLTVGGSDFVCSASSVRSANRDLVVTAGHCVKDGAGAWADNWTFVPGYAQGRRPYGQYTARRMFVAGPWSRKGDDSHDIGMVAVGTSGGRHLGDVAGGQDIAFGTPRGRSASGFGFPADTPYDGEHLVYCSGPLRDDPNGQTTDQGMRCDMTAGSSGGPWLAGFDPATGRGTIVSVSSFKYSDDRRTMYGPYFGTTARNLYTVAGRS
ncbi:trypsin-like serine peptidase [Streptosporangium sp. DT93]|uniref:trypsin-like serine peptidase n=1 Tax=Streptosporangium sp. DT93 TaxID=3393428 RepID=UPI003CEE829C